MTTTFVSGATGGIGSAIVEQLLDDPGACVVAGVRDTHHSTLAELRRRHPGRTTAVVVDLASAEGVRGLGEALSGVGPIDTFVHCAATTTAPGRTPAASKGPLADLEGVAFAEVLHTNVVGAALLLQHVVPHLTAAPDPLVVHVTSQRGSMSLDQGAGSIAYAVSKAALNMLTRKVAAELDGIRVVGLDPGWVRTPMGGDDAPQTAEDTAASICALVSSGRGSLRTGCLVDRHGRELPW